MRKMIISLLMTVFSVSAVVAGENSEKKSFDIFVQKVAMLRIAPDINITPRRDIIKAQYYCNRNTQGRRFCQRRGRGPGVEFVCRCTRFQGTNWFCQNYRTGRRC